MDCLLSKKQDLCDKVYVNKVEYLIIKGYEKFRFRYDKFVGKYSVVNSENIEIETEPFIDDVIFSELPLETWTANYVCVRVNEDYYLMDADGNCYYKHNSPFIICRNLFVSGDKRFVVNCELNMPLCNEISVWEDDGYCFAMRNDGNDIYELLDIYGYTCCKVTTDCLKEFAKWYTSTVEFEDRICFFDKEFKTIPNPVLYNFELVGEKSKTYVGIFKIGPSIVNTVQRYYSTYFHAFVEFKKIGKLEIIEYDDKTYYFDVNGDVETIQYTGIQHFLMEEYIVYRVGGKILARDLNGRSKTSGQVLEWKEMYQFTLMEDILKALKKLNK